MEELKSYKKELKAQTLKTEKENIQHQLNLKTQII